MDYTVCKLKRLVINMSDYDLELYGVIGDMFRHLRKDKGYTLEVVAEQLNITPKTLQRYECGTRRFKIETVQGLCSIYKIDYYIFMRDAKICHANIASRDSLFLTDNEKNIIRAYRQADTISKEMVLRSLNISEKGEVEKMA